LVAASPVAPSTTIAPTGHPTCGTGTTLAVTIAVSHLDWRDVCDCVRLFRERARRVGPLTNLTHIYTASDDRKTDDGHNNLAVTASAMLLDHPTLDAAQVQERWENYFCKTLRDSNYSVLDNAQNCKIHMTHDGQDLNPSLLTARAKARRAVVVNGQD
jgi:hypothetical protein